MLDQSTGGDYGAVAMVCTYSPPAIHGSSYLWSIHTISVRGRAVGTPITQ